MTDTSAADPLYKVPAYDGDDYTTKAIYHAITALKSEKGTQGPLMCDDPLGDNIARAQRAAEAVRAYAKQDGIYAGETVYLALGDLMNDLRHLLDFVGLEDGGVAADGYPTDLELLASRDVHYQAEIRGEF